MSVSESEGGRKRVVAFGRKGEGEGRGREERSKVSRENDVKVKCAVGNREYGVVVISMINHILVVSVSPVSLVEHVLCQLALPNSIECGSKDFLAEISGATISLLVCGKH